MLQKINHIKNIGKFYNVSPKGTDSSDPSFKKFNLIYADNGTGKSTISTILKSLWRNDSQLLIEKRTIGANDETSVSLKIGEKDYIFCNGKWNNKPEIECDIFDEDFIAKNIFLGDNIDTNNRRELFKHVVLGEDNVKKVEEIKRLTDLINNDIKPDIEEGEKRLKALAKIDNIKNIDEATKLDEDELNSISDRLKKAQEFIKNQERIENEVELKEISIFQSIDYQNSIAADLGRLSDNAKYKSHIQNHNGWLKDGLDILEKREDNSCPFCFQSLDGNDAITTYQTFFSQEYENLRKIVKDQLSLIDSIYNDSALKNIEFIFENQPMIAPDRSNQNQEDRLNAIGKNQDGRYAFIAFTIRKISDRNLIRPISARYMHKKEIDHYER
jgi:wobble nucleotide-excising tRNase